MPLITARSGLIEKAISPRGTNASPATRCIQLVELQLEERRGVRERDRRSGMPIGDATPAKSPQKDFNEIFGSAQEE